MESVFALIILFTINLFFQRGSEYRPADAVPRTDYDANQGEAGSVDDLNQVLHSVSTHIHAGIQTESYGTL